jgi:8-oxo-dGTP pyrophosphatase MutT (NUDIX family)/phosphohistidine phosphatase SixA
VALSDGGEQVRAAGGVVRRAGRAGEEVLLVHRPRYRDWTFPKGKAHPGETDEETALREVEEETGLTCVLGDELPSTAYRDSRARQKVVRYWTMRVESGSFEPHGEVDEVRWIPRRNAEASLSYDRDNEVIRAVRPPLLVIRHATAGSSEEWVGDDARRPLDERGRRQATALVEQLAPFELERILSSPHDRCRQTVEPLAAALGLEVELTDELAEGSGEERVRSLLVGMRGTATAACGHGPELVPLFGKTKKGATVVVEAANGALGELGRLPPPV